MKKVLFNTLKITLAAIISILISDFMHLEFYISAGIVTILTIQSTKKETIQTAIERLFAFIIALFIAYICFYICGFTVVGFSLYLFVYIFICQYYKWYSSMAVNSVLISHFLSFGYINDMSLFNEIGLFIIGVSIGVIANLHLHKNRDYMNELKQQADQQIQYILLRMSKRIINQAEDYDGNCFETLNYLIVQAKAVSIENDNNVVLVKDTFDKDYIAMREEQSQVLYEMYKIIRKINTTPMTAHIISDFLKKISDEYHVDNDCEELLQEFKSIDIKMESVPLPITRQEFEDRARLFTLLKSIEEFLKIKKAFYEKKE